MLWAIAGGLSAGALDARKFHEWGTWTTLMIYSTLTLLLPEMVKGINNNMMYIFGGVNVVTIPIGE